VCACDPIWQEMLCSSAQVYPKKLYTAFNLFYHSFKNYQIPKMQICMKQHNMLLEAKFKVKFSKNQHQNLSQESKIMQNLSP